jgi:hypothetical protein
MRSREQQRAWVLTRLLVGDASLSIIGGNRLAILGTVAVGVSRSAAHLSKGNRRFVAVLRWLRSLSPAALASPAPRRSSRPVSTGRSGPPPPTPSSPGQRDRGPIMHLAPSAIPAAKAVYI